MEYAVLVYEPKSELAKRNDPEQVGPYMAPYAAYWEALEKAGVAAGGNGLDHPDRATTLRIRDGKRDVQDGPFAETKEMLGGLFIINVESEEEALQWAAKCPSATTGSVEVRPLMPDIDSDEK